jgi:chromatin remodeling complex protein RSC6
LKEQKNLSTVTTHKHFRTGKLFNEDGIVENTTMVNRKPTGFQIKRPIVPELANFLDVDEDTEMNWIEVNKAINKYIEQNNLKNPTDKRLVNPDAKLKKLLNVDSSFSFTAMQGKFKPLFKPKTN